MTILGIIQARFSSSRLPGKVMKPILDEPMLFRQMERINHSKLLTKAIVATSTDASDDVIYELCKKKNIESFRGDLNNVLLRFYHATKNYNPTHVVRLTGDCPLIDPNIIDKIIQYHLEGEFDYTSNTVEPTFPDGLDVEIFKFTLLAEAMKEAFLPSQKEHVTPFFYTQPHRYKIGSFKNASNYSHLRWTVDEIEDYYLVNQIYSCLYKKNMRFNFEDILNLLNEKPELKTLNINFKRNEGMKKSLIADQEFMKND